MESVQVAILYSSRVISEEKINQVAYVLKANSVAILYSSRVISEVGAVVIVIIGFFVSQSFIHQGLFPKRDAFFEEFPWLNKYVAILYSSRVISEGHDRSGLRRIQDLSGVAILYSSRVISEVMKVLIMSCGL